MKSKALWIKKRGIFALLGGIVLSMGLILFANNNGVEASGSQNITMAKINASGGNIDIKQTSKKNISCTYDKTKYMIQTSVKNNSQIVSISVKNNVDLTFSDRCVVFVPTSFTDVSIVADKAGVYLTDINANLDINCDYGAASVIFPLNYTKKVNYSVSYGSGELDFRNIENYSITGIISTSTISAPKEYNFKKVYGKAEKCSYMKGNGDADININISNSAIDFIKRTLKRNASSSQNITMTKINASGGNIDIKQTSKENISFTYDKAKYDVQTSVKDKNQTVSITVKDHAEITFSDRCVVFVPANFTNVSIVVDKAGVYLTDINANLDINCDYGVASVIFPLNYAKKVNYTVSHGTGKLDLSSVEDYSITGTISTSTISAPKEYNLKKIYSKSQKYSYMKGNGDADININSSNSTIKFVD